MSLETLEGASVGGVPYLFQSVTIMAGRKIVIFEYPFKNSRDVEDLGGLSKTFTITGITTGDNATYRENRDNLINELERGGITEIVLPLMGRFNVSHQTYDVTEDTRSLGAAQFKMIFLETEAPEFPTISPDNRAFVNQLSIDLNNQIVSELSNKWEVNDSFINNFTNALNLILEIYLTVLRTSRIFKNLLDAVNNFRRVLNQFKSSAPRLVASGPDLGESLIRLYENLDNLGQFPEDRVDIAVDQFAFNSKFDEIVTTTVGLTQRKNNRRLLDLCVNLAALSNAYRSIPQIDFRTQDQINNVRDSVETQYRLIKKRNEDQTLEQETTDILDDMRNQVRIYIDTQAATASKIITVNTHMIPLKVLVFSYYGNLDNYEAILDLNGFANPAFVEGDVKILST